MPFMGSKVMQSTDGSAIKYIFELSDHQFIESVVIQEKTYKTLCVSSQCGCPVNCQFCLTGKMGYKRNLEVSEIIAQLLAVQGRCTSNF